MESYRQYMVLFESGGLGEFVGFYKGANNAEMPVYKIGDLYYLLQNPTSGSIFGAMARRGFTLYWEIRSYPKFGEIQYTGKIVHLFKLTTKGDVHDFFNKLLKYERELMKEKHISF